MREVFPIIPATGIGPWLLLGFVAAIMIAVLVLVGVSVIGSRAARFEITDDGVRVRGDLYGRTLAWRDLVIDSTRAVDLETQPSLRPARRTLGTSLPGYSAGWFRLQDGQKALLYVTDRRRVVYLATRRGHAVLLSVAEPHAFVDALRRAAAN